MFFLLTALGLTLFLGSFLVAGAPSWPRLVLLIPLAAGFIGLAVFDLGRWLIIVLNSFLPARWSIVLLVTAAMIFFFSLGLYEWNLYYATVGHDGLITSRIGRFLGTFPTNVTACDISGAYHLHIYELEFLAGERQFVDIPAEASNDQLARCPKSNSVWVLYPDYFNRLDDIRAYAPGGTTEEHLDRDGNLGFITYALK
jgi:hypothetical protein